MNEEKMADTANPPGKTTVEMVEISEQLEPLMLKKTSVQLRCEKDSGFCILNADSDGDTPTTPCLKSGNAAQEHDSPPNHTEEVVVAGGIPKSCKRPGSMRDSQCVTMTGTVKTGNSVGQPVEVQLELTENEFHRLTSRESQSKEDHRCECDRSQGPHIIFWSILCIPVAMVISVCISFYNGSMTWYNLVVYFSEERSLAHKLTICPVLILSFPLSVGLSACAVAITASIMQVSWSWQWWWMEICDGEKGFYGWFCSIVGLPTCSPYQVVVLDDTST